MFPFLDFLSRITRVIIIRVSPSFFRRPQAALLMGLFEVLALELEERFCHERVAGAETGQESGYFFASDAF